MKAVSLVLPAVVLSCLLTACSGSGLPDPRSLPTSEVSGRWLSTQPVGSLGTLELRLQRRDLSRVYDALLFGQSGVAFGAEEGYGTLAGGHLLLSFGAGEPLEYYFEGRVVDNGSVITGIAGQFVFPRQPEMLTVSFSYAGPLPDPLS